MSKTHWKKLVNPEYLGAYSLEDGQDMVLTIRSVGVETVVGAQGKKEECTVARFDGSGKPMILNRTNMKMITKLYKTPYIEDWAGKRVQVFQDVTKMGGETVECLRIRPFVPKTNDAEVCEACGAIIGASGKMNGAQVAAYTVKKYGKMLCGSCATAETERKKAAEMARDALGGGVDHDSDA